MLPVSVHVSRLLSPLENTTRLSGSIKGVNHSRDSLLSCRENEFDETRTTGPRFADADRVSNANTFVTILRRSRFAKTRFIRSKWSNRRMIGL